MGYRASKLKVHISTNIKTVARMVNAERKRKRDKWLCEETCNHAMLNAVTMTTATMSVATAARAKTSAPTAGTAATVASTSAATDRACQ